MRYFYTLLFLLFAICLQAQTDRQFIRDGNRLYRQKQYAEAEILYRKAVAKNASNPQAVYNLGCALMMQQKDSAAVVQYEKATKLEKNKLRLSKAYHNMGVICQNHQMYGEAIKAYEQSLRNNPGDDETRYNLVLCKRKNKEQQKNQQQQQQKKKEEKKDEQKDKKQQDQQDKQEQQQQQQQDQQMSKENAEQLLNAAIQDEKQTQQRLKKAMQQPQRRQTEKNW